MKKKQDGSQNGLLIADWTGNSRRGALPAAGWPLKCNSRSAFCKNNIFLWLKIPPGFSTMILAVKIRHGKGDAEMGFVILGGGLLIVIIAVVVSVVSSVVSAVAADQDIED